jgi:hypothetical protein
MLPRGERPQYMATVEQVYRARTAPATCEEPGRRELGCCGEENEEMSPVLTRSRPFCTGQVEVAGTNIYHQIDTNQSACHLLALLHDHPTRSFQLSSYFH